MIARMWHDITPEAKGDNYCDFLNERATPDDRGTPGNLALYILRRDEGGKTHFIRLTFWESLDAIKGFAGDPVDRARHYPVQHWEIARQRPVLKMLGAAA